MILYGYSDPNTFWNNSSWLNLSWSKRQDAQCLGDGYRCRGRWIYPEDRKPLALAAEVTFNPYVGGIHFLLRSDPPCLDYRALPRCFRVGLLRRCRAVPRTAPLSVERIPICGSSRRAMNCFGGFRGVSEEAIQVSLVDWSL